MIYNFPNHLKPESPTQMPRKELKYAKKVRGERAEGGEGTG